MSNLPVPNAIKLRASALLQAPISKLATIGPGANVVLPCTNKVQNGI